MTGSSLGRFVASLRSCGLQPTDRVAVALSGGPDSLALASMAVWWQRFTRQVRGVAAWLLPTATAAAAACRPPPPLQHQLTSPAQPDAPLALIVDHKLRPESSEEARAVAAQATAMGMEARVLTVEWPACAPPALGDKMVAAREARYALLLHACAEAGRSTLLLAHHADDQAETFLLRLMHASGVAGLACMPRVADKRAGADGGPGAAGCVDLPGRCGRERRMQGHRAWVSPASPPPIHPSPPALLQATRASGWCARCWNSTRLSWRRTAAGAGCPTSQTPPMLSCRSTGTLGEGSAGARLCAARVLQGTAR